MDIKKIKEINTFIFDCDGVILNSNKLKTDTFRNIALPFGVSVAEEFVNYHLNNGGISRYQKFNYLTNKILPKYNQKNLLVEKKIPNINDLLALFAHQIQDGLLSCEIAHGLDKLKNILCKARWMIVSGSDENELRKLLKDRNIDHYFEYGIFGSPDTKDKILNREIQLGKILKPAVYFGDSIKDYEAAQRAGVDFMFVYEWTEIKNWKSYILKNQINSIKSITELIKII